MNRINFLNQDTYINLFKSVTPASWRGYRPTKIHLVCAASVVIAVTLIAITCFLRKKNVGRVDVKSQPIQIRPKPVESKVKANSSEPIVQQPKVELEVIKLAEFTKDQTLPEPDLKHPQAALQLFSLFNAGFTGADSDGSLYNHSMLGLGFLLRELSILATKPRLAAYNDSLKGLIKSFQCAYYLGSWSQVLQNHSDVHQVEKITAHIRDEMLECLLEEGFVLIPSGYASVPVGHAIIIKLQLIERDGQKLVSGEMINRGEGAGYHPYRYILEGKSYIDPFIQLDEVSFEVFKSSKFIDYHLDLRLCRRGEETLPFTIEDFYEVLLPTWPGELSLRKVAFPSTEQYAGNCTVKPYIAAMQNELPDEVVRYIVSHLTSVNIEELGDLGQLHASMLSYVDDSLSKFMRRTIKLQRAKFLTEEELVDALTFVKGKRHQIETHREKQRDDSLLRSGPLNESPFDNESWALNVPVGQSPKLSSAKPVPFVYLSDGSEINDLLSDTLNKGLSLLDQQSAQVKYFILELAEKLPPASATYWKEQVDESTMRTLWSIFKLFQKGEARRDGDLFITGSLALASLKLFAISVASGETLGLPESLVSYFAKSGEHIFKMSESHFRPLTPLEAHDYRESMAVIYSHAAKSKSFIQTRTVFDLPYLARKNFDSLSTLLEDPHTSYLYDRLTAQPELYNTRWQGVVNHRFDQIQNTIGLTHGKFEKSLPAPYSALAKGYLSCLLFYYLAMGRVERAIRTQDGQIGLDFQIGFTRSGSRATRAITLYSWYAKERSRKLQSVGIFFNVHDSRANLCLVDQINTPINGPYRLLRLMSKCNVHGQNSVLRLRNGQEGIPSLEWHQLILMHLYPDLAVPMWMDYLSHHTERLRKPEMQVFLSTALFAKLSGKSEFLIERIVTENSLVFRSLLVFLRSKLSATCNLQWLDIYFLYLRVYVQTLNYASAKGLKLHRESSFLVEHLKTLTTNPDWNAEKKKEINYFITTLTRYCQWSPELQESCRLAWLDAGEAIAPHSTVIEEDFQRAERILSKLSPLQRTGIPSWVRSHDLFPYRSISKVRQIEGGSFSFVNDFGHRTYLSVSGNSFTLHRKFVDKNGQRVLFERRDHAPFNDSAEGPHKDGVLVQGTSFWYRTGGPEQEVICLSPMEKQVLCRADSQAIFHPDEEDLQLAKDCYRHPPAVCKTAFRLLGQNQTLVWKNKQNKITKITIPSLNLTFSTQKEKWTCSKAPGYFLDSYQNHPAMGSYSNYVVLVNKRGEKMMLVMNHRFKQEVPTIPALTPLKAEPTLEPKILAYSLDKEGNILPPESAVEHLYLIYFFLMQRSYSQAQAYLTLLKKDYYEWNDHALTIASEFETDEKKSYDRHPAACSIRLHVKLLQTASYPCDSRDSICVSDYQAYLTHWNNTFGHHLSTEEEQHCLGQYDVMVSNDKVFSHREQVLRGEASGKITRLMLSAMVKDERSRQRNFAWLTAERLVRMKQYLAEPQPMVFTLRPDSRFVDHFLYFYQIIRSLPKDDANYQNVMEMIRISRYTADSAVHTTSHILLAVAAAPEAHPTVEELIQQYTSSLSDSHFSKIFSKKPFTDLFPQEWSFNSHFKLTQQTYEEVTLPVPLKGTASVAPTPVVRAVIPCTTLSVDLKDLLQLDYLREIPMIQRETAREEERQALVDLQKVYTTIPSQDPGSLRIAKRMLEGINEQLQIVSKPLLPAYTVNVDQSKLQNIKEWLRDEASDIQIRLDNLQNCIENALKSSRAIIQAEVEGKLLPVLTFKEILLAVANDQDELLYEANPDLAPNTLQELKTVVTEYLILGTHQQLFLRTETVRGQIVELLEKGELPDSPEVQSLSEKMAKTLLAPRAYKTTEDLYVPLFEYFANVRLRKEQYKAYQKLTSLEDLKNLQLEAPTGFGKTTVVTVLWLLKMSRHRSLTMMTLPLPLLASAQSMLKKILGHQFHRYFFVFKFDRQQASQFLYVKNKIDLLKSAKKDKKIILTSIDTLHRATNLQLKQSLYEKEDSSLITALTLLRHICSTEISNFVDESRECFDVKRRYDYAVGNPKKISYRRCRETTNVYQHILLTPDVLSRFNFEFLPETYSEDKITITPENYIIDLLPTLAKNAIDYLKLPENIHAIAFKDLQKQPIIDEEKQQLVGSLSKEKLKTYRSIRRQLTRYLARTLNRNCDEHYRLDKNSSSRLARPASYGVVKKKSEFSTVEELKNFTIQANLKHPVRLCDVQSYINRLSATLIDDSDDVASLHIVKLYQSICNSVQSLPENPCDIEPDDIQEITNELNKNRSLRLKFMTSTTLSEITYYKKKICSSPYQVISASKHINCASGTIEPDTLPSTTGQFHEKNFTPITLSKYSLSQPAA